MTANDAGEFKEPLQAALPFSLGAANRGFARPEEIAFT
jgi:hypothetical protein